MTIDIHELRECALCDSDIVLGRERSFVVGEQAALCFECAVRCGGVYDDAHHSWTVLPAVNTLQGLPLEETAMAQRRYRACCEERRHSEPAGPT